MKLWRRLTDPSPVKAMVAFYRAMAAMINAGIPLTRALYILSEHGDNLQVREAVQGCAQLVQEGQPLSRSMARSSPLFSNADVAMIRVGEETGSLHRVLDRVALQQEAGYALRARLRAALVYPLFVFAVCLILLLAIPGLAFDGLLRFFEEMRLELPWSTRVMLAGCRLGRSPVFWVLLVTGTAAAFTILKSFLEHPRWRHKLDQALRGIPGVGTVLITAAAGDFCRLLAAMYDSGIPMLKALHLASSSNPSPVLAERIAQAAEALREGQPLAQALRERGGMPPMIYHLVEAGEQSGALTELVNSGARLCEEALDESLVVAEGLLQPLMLAFLGGLAGFVVIATMSPMIQLAQTL